MVQIVALKAAGTLLKHGAQEHNEHFFISFQLFK